MAEPAVRTAADIEAELAEFDNNTRNLPADDDVEDDVQSEDTASEAELEAGTKGWVPKSKYKGDPAKWVDAGTFLARGQRFNNNLQKQVEVLTQKLADFEGTKKAFIKFHEETIAKKDEEIKSAISALRIQRSQATREGDDELAIQLEDRIELLNEQRKEVKAIPAAQPVSSEVTQAEMDNPILQEWVEDGNSWFKDDPKLRDFSVKLAEEMLAKGETLRGRKFLDLVASRMKEEFPRRFREKSDAPAPKALTESGSSGSGRSSASGRSERELPSADREIMRSLIAGGYTTKEKFLASYFSRN